MSNKHQPQKITSEITLVPCKISKDGKSFVPVHTPLRPSDLEKLKKTPWSNEEDEFLRELGAKHTKWTLIAKEINSNFHNNVLIRNQKHCRERWKNFVDPDLKKKPFSKFEDELILKFYEKYQSWAKVAKELKNRNENQVKNRYKALKEKHSPIEPDEKKPLIDNSSKFNSISGFPHLDSLSSQFAYLAQNSGFLPNLPLDQVLSPLSSQYPSFSMQPECNEMFGTGIVSPSVSRALCHDSKTGIFFNTFGESFSYSKCDSILDNFCDQGFGNS